jgi:hypothetical protein
MTGNRFFAGAKTFHNEMKGQHMVSRYRMQKDELKYGHGAFSCGHRNLWASSNKHFATKTVKK